MIKIENISFKYPNDYIAVQNLNLEIKQGEKIAIIGQNGAGKTTTVKMLNGLLRPFKGKIFVNNVDIKNMTTANISKTVGYVFQNPSDQLFNKTVYDEIAYSLRKNKFSKSEIEKRVNYAAKLCNISEFLNENPYELPLSLRKFVTIAIVIANDCDIIILDEPTAGQDLFGNENLEKIINELNKNNKTVIIISHDMDFVIKNFKRVIVMADKELRFDGNPIDIFYNDDLLKLAKLDKPIATKLAIKLNLKEKILTAKEFALAYKNKDKN